VRIQLDQRADSVLVRYEHVSCVDHAGLLLLRWICRGDNVPHGALLIVFFCCVVCRDASNALLPSTAQRVRDALVFAVCVEPGVLVLRRHAVLRHVIQYVSDVRGVRDTLMLLAMDLCT
jgi:hypothetical protein